MRKRYGRLAKGCGLLATASVAVFLFYPPATARADSISYWIGGSGAWSDPAHWSNTPGGTGGYPPGPGSDVIIHPPLGTYSIQVKYDANPGSLSQLTINNSILNQGEFNGSFFDLSASIEHIYNPMGYHNQYGGNNSIGELQLTNSGNYYLYGGTLTAGTILLDSGTFSQTGGTLNAQVFNQNGGTVKGVLQNKGTFNYNNGTFAGRLLNQGAVVFNNDFTAGDGIDNQTALYINGGRSVTLNGYGLVNEGIMSVSGALQGSGTLQNYGSMAVYGGTIGGSGGFQNYGFLNQGSGAAFTLSNTGANANYGNMTLAQGDQMRLTGGNLTNFGSLNLNSAIVTGTATLTNSYGGTIFGQGTILSPFANLGGVIAVENGATYIMNAFSNSGVIQLAGLTANLTGGNITNAGTIEGYGNVGNDILNKGIIEARGGTLTLSGTSITNSSIGLMAASTGNKLLVADTTLTNNGVINLTGGTLDTNNHGLTNAGQISGYGTIRTGKLKTSNALTNQGTMTFTGGLTTVNGDVTNEAGGHIEVAYDPALFTGTVNNYGQFKATQTRVTFTGTYNEHGSYISDPSTNSFIDLVVAATGYLTGGVGDNFYINNDFLNHSLQNTNWDTLLAYLEFQTGDDTAHNFALAGMDLGATMRGYHDNFAWGTLDLADNNTLSISDGIYEGQNPDGAALYVNAILGLNIFEDRNSQWWVSNISGQTGLNIYYNAMLDENGYLHGLTYDLMGGGQLIPVSGETNPVPEPATMLLLGTGLATMAVARSRKRGNMGPQGC